MASLKKRATAGGRPRIPASDQRTEVVKLLVTPSEREELAAKAQEESLTVSTWGRLALLRLARERGGRK